MNTLLLAEVTHKVNGWAVVGLIVGGVGLVISFVLVSIYYTWIQARRAGVLIPYISLIAMSLRKVPHKLIVDTCIKAAASGITCDPIMLEAHYLARGNITEVVEALVLAKEVGVELTWNKACAIDLASKSTGTSLLKTVRSSISTGLSVDDAYKSLK